MPVKRFTESALITSQGGGVEKRYARLELEFQLGSKQERVEGLVSEMGARRVLEVPMLPKHYQQLTGKIIPVTIQNLQIPGMLTKEILPESSFYNIRFLHRDPGTRMELAKYIEQNGFPSPWRRVYPRIPIVDLDGVDLPSIAMVENPEEGIQFYKILNFTIGGLLFENDIGNSVAMELGDRFYFQILTVNGTTLSGVSGKIVRIDEDVEAGRFVIRYGVQILAMNEHSQKKYRELILDYCEKVKRMGRA